MKQPTKQTPLEILLADKEQIRQQCRQQEQKLDQAYAYAQEHVGSLLLSGLFSLLFSNAGESKKRKDVTSSRQLSVAKTPAVSLGLSDYLKVGQMMLPVIWDIAQPVIIAWGIRKIKTLFRKRVKV